MIYDNEVLISMIRDYFGFDSYVIEIESVHDKWGSLSTSDALFVYYSIIIDTKSSRVVRLDRSLYLINLSNKIADIRNDKLKKIGI